MAAALSLTKTHAELLHHDVGAVGIQAWLVLVEAAAANQAAAGAALEPDPVCLLVARRAVEQLVGLPPQAHSGLFSEVLFTARD